MFQVEMLRNDIIACPLVVFNTGVPAYLMRRTPHCSHIQPVVKAPTATLRKESLSFMSLVRHNPPTTNQ